VSDADDCGRRHDCIVALFDLAYQQQKAVGRSRRQQHERLPFGLLLAAYFSEDYTCNFQRLPSGLASAFHRIAGFISGDLIIPLVGQTSRATRKWRVRCLRDETSLRRHSVAGHGLRKAAAALLMMMLSYRLLGVTRVRGEIRTGDLRSIDSRLCLFNWQPD